MQVRLHSRHKLWHLSGQLFEAPEDDASHIQNLLVASVCKHGLQASVYKCLLACTFAKHMVRGVFALSIQPSRESVIANRHTKQHILSIICLTFSLSWACLRWSK